MSDSDLSDAPSSNAPSDTQLEKSLRNQVIKAARAQKEATVNTIRAASEKELGLDEGFYANHTEWKGRSKDIIKNQFEIPADEPAKHETKPSPVSKSKPSKKAQAKPLSKKPVKRKSPEEPQKPRKKPKPASEDEESELSSPPVETDEEFEEEVAKPVKSKPSAAQPKGAKTAKKEKAKKPETMPMEESGSEMSVLLDNDEPPPKKRAKSKESSGPKAKPAKASKTDSNAAVDPDLEEIKQLQGWLVKCGVRKVWGKELKPFDKPKAKIKHLKEMLADVGMTGRYSNDKASQIREARELAADIEAVQEGAQRWGKSGDEDEEDGDEKRPASKRLVRGSKHYDFLSSDGEETD